MGKKEVVTITDDIDGRAGAETVTFAYAGRSYEIDLGEKNKAKLEKALEPFIGAARKAGGNRVAARKTSGRSASRPTSAGLDPLFVAGRPSRGSRSRNAAVWPRTCWTRS